MNPDATEKPVILDPVLSALLTQLDRASQHPPATIEAQKNHALNIGKLSRDIRFRLGPPWHHPAAVIDYVAKHLKAGIDTMQGTDSLPLIRELAENATHRMNTILADRDGPTSRKDR